MRSFMSGNLLFGSKQYTYTHGHPLLTLRFYFQAITTTLFDSTITWRFLAWQPNSALVGIGSDRRMRLNPYKCQPTSWHRIPATRRILYTVDRGP